MRARASSFALVVIVSALGGCAALADRDEDAMEHRPTAPPAVTRRVIVLPVYNATGRVLRTSSEERLGGLEPFFSPRDPARPLIPELIQAGGILASDVAGSSSPTMAWINQRVPRAPETVEAAFELAAREGLAGHVVWVALREWDDMEWRQRGALTVSADVARFDPDDPGSLRVRVFQRRRIPVPPFSSLAQAAGHVGLRLVQMTE